MTKVSRYIIILDRMDDDDDVHLIDNEHPENIYYGEPRTDKEGMEQVARELQEAMEITGVPAGFFRVVARSEVEYDTAIHIVTPDEVAHRAAIQVLDNTRTY